MVGVKRQREISNTKGGEFVFNFYSFKEKKGGVNGRMKRDLIADISLL